jgi:anti-sigma regulatory factor (Ser/Thr protein kinase)
MQRVIVPNVCEDGFVGDSFNYLVQVIEQTRQADSGDTVVWDFHDVSFLHPFFLAPLAIFRHQAVQDIRCENISLQMQSYLNGIHFDRLLHFENATRETAEQVMAQYANRSYIPLCSFSMTDGNKDAFCSIARNVIVRQTQVGSAVNTPLSYFLSELIDNIYEHSGSPNGYLFSQYLDGDRSIYLCIADSGITIPGNYQRTGLYQLEIDGDPAEALRLANEGRSTKNRPETENRGYGISTSKRMLVEGLGGSFFMLSGSAFHRYENHSLNYYADISRFFRWDGTLILLRIPINAPEGFNYINYLE